MVRAKKKYKPLQQLALFDMPAQIREQKVKPLTKEMARAMAIINHFGEIHRYPGGYWHPKKNLIGYHAEFVKTLTLNALEKRNLIEVAERKVGYFGSFAIKYVLKIKL